MTYRQLDLRRPYDLRLRLQNWTVAHSGHQFRDYLGMSQIGDCSLRLYNNLVYGREVTTKEQLKFYQGYLHERDILARLADLDDHHLGPAREFSDFAGRFRGHSDGEWWGDLLEIKSTIAEKLQQIRETKRVPTHHFWQAQTYMYYGRYQRALVIYVARDTGQLYVAELRRLEHIGEAARLKAATILEAVDHRQPPECECGNCLRANGNGE